MLKDLLLSVPVEVYAGVILALVMTAVWTPLLALAGVSATRSRPLNLLLVRQLYSLNGLIWLLLTAMEIYNLLTMPLLPEGAETISSAFLGLERYAWWHEPRRLLLLGMLGASVCEAVLSFILASCWKRLRPKTVLLWCCTALLVLFLAGVGCLGWWQLVQTTSCPFLKSVPLRSAAILIILCGLGICAATGLLWLLFRRNRDAFGRDYYAFAARRCARIAGWSSLVTLFGLMILLVLLLPLLSGIVLTPETLSPATLRDSVSAAVLRLPERVWLIPSLLCAPLLAELAFVLVVRDTVPMRRKLAMLCGWLCLILTAILFIRLLVGLF